jgi:hypothetical protein
MARIAVTLSGQWRFSRNAIESLVRCVVRPLQQQHEVGLFLHAWSQNDPPKGELNFLQEQLPVHFLQYQAPPSVYNSPFDASTHSHKDRYRSQFESVCRAHLLVAASAFNPDMVLRTRMDLVYFSKLKMPRRIMTRTVYVPPVEGHMETPFEPAVVNDQVALGDSVTMSTYMRLVRELTPAQLSMLEEGSTPTLSRNYKLRTPKGVEEVLCEYLKARNITIQRLNLFYTLERLPISPKKSFCASVPMVLYGSAPNRVSPWLIDKSFSILSRIGSKLSPRQHR